MTKKDARKMVEKELAKINSKRNPIGDSFKNKEKKYSKIGSFLLSSTIVYGVKCGINYGVKTGM